MRAIVLCAGYATRLYPLTKDKPKPLLPIAGKLMIERISEKIEEVKEIDEIFVVTNNKFYNQFAEWSKTYTSNKKINVINDCTNTNEDRLGAIGDLDFVIKKEKIDDEVLVIAGDNLFEFSLVDFYKFYRTKKASVVAVRDLGDTQMLAGKLGVVLADKNSRITDFEEKPPIPKSTLASTACYIFTKADIKEFEECIKKNNKPDNLGDFIRFISSKKKMYAFVFRERWFDIGSYDQLAEADRIFSGGAR